MNHLVAHADALRRVFAPDGIEILPIVLPGLRFVTVAEGRIPPGTYRAHFHFSLEQVTYVLEGAIEVTTWDPQANCPSTVRAEPGEAVATLPNQSLSFANSGPFVARVLFITAPPYPQDDADTQLLDTQRLPTDAERETSLARHRQAVEAMAAIVEERSERLRRGEAPG